MPPTPSGRWLWAGRSLGNYSKGVITTSGREVTVTFPEPGTWQVTLVVKDSNGLPAATRGTVEVRPAG